MHTPDQPREPSSNSSDNGLSRIEGSADLRGLANAARSRNRDDDYDYDDDDDSPKQPSTPNRDKDGRRIISDPNEIAEYLAEHEREQREAAKSAVENMELQIRFLRKRFNLEDPNDPKKSKQDWTDIPLTADEREMFQDAVDGIAEDLKQNVRGQDHAVDLAVDALVRAAAGVDPDEKPLGSFLAVGRTGTGKTFLGEQLAAALAQRVKGLPFKFMKIDCAEYKQGHEGSRLIGSPPGYIGSDKKNQFDQIIEHPYWVVLFDEIEKGSESLHDLMLAILDKARATTAQGKPVSFRRCIVIMTSNIGVQDIDQATEEGIGFGAQSRKPQSLTAEQIMAVTAGSLRAKLKAEFLNRIDEVVPFRDLTPEVLREIAENELAKVSRVASKNNGCTVRFSDAVTDYVIENSDAQEYQAREIKRTIQRMVSTPLGKTIVRNRHSISNSIITVDVEDGEIVVQNEPKVRALPLGEQQKAA